MCTNAGTLLERALYSKPRTGGVSKASVTPTCCRAQRHCWSEFALGPGITRRASSIFARPHLPPLLMSMLDP